MSTASSDMPPRLLYLGDVAVESSCHGSTLLFRLLQRHPPDRLRIVEGNLFPASTDQRLAGVTHSVLPVGRRRLLNTRFHEWYSRWLLETARGRAGNVAQLVASFHPDVVLTVGHGYTWVTASQFAKRSGLPLILIVHDDWPRAVGRSLEGRVDRMFGDVYREAAVRLCASPGMADDYRRRYGVPGIVLLPYRSATVAAFAPAADRRRHRDEGLVFAFAGTINSPGYAELLRKLADALMPHQGRVLIFGPTTPADAGRWGLNLSNVTFGGLLKSADLLVQLRQQADVLFVPMSFAEADRPNMRMGFPSKLTDYTAVGLPLLICGPPECSAARWSRDNGDIAEVVTSDDQAAIAVAVTRLAGDGAYRLKLAIDAQRVGDRDFSAVAADAVFQQALASARLA